MEYDTYQIVPGLLNTSPTLKLGTAYINERTRTLLAGQVDWFVGHSYLVLRLGVEQPLLFLRLRAGATYTTGDILRLAGGLGLSLGPFYAVLGCMVDPAFKTTGASVSLSLGF